MKALINKEMYYGCSEQTKSTNNQAVYNSENDVAFFNFDNASLKLKKAVQDDKSTFIDFFIGKAKKFDEIIVSFDVRNTSGESVVSLRTSFGEEKVAINKIGSREWRNRKIKLVLKQDSDFTFFTVKILAYKTGECEIRNVVLTHNSNVLLNSENQNRKYLTQAISNLNATSNEFVYLGYFKKKQYGMNSINAMSFNESRTELYTVSYWNNSEFMQDSKLKAHRTALTVPKVKGFHYEFYFYEEDDKFHIVAKKIVNSQGLFILSSNGEYDNGDITPVDFTQYTKIKNYDAGVSELNGITTLDTPYYSRKMEKEGVLQDFDTYMDKKYEYNKKQQLLKNEAGIDRMVLSKMEEPKPSSALQNFIDKWVSLLKGTN